MIKNLSQFKKSISVGTEFTIVKHYIKPICDNETRIVTRTQTNGLYSIPKYKNIFDDKDYTKGIWLDYPKASDMEFNDDVIVFKYKGSPLLSIKQF